MLLALPDGGSPWEPSRDCLPDEIADERIADGVDEWRRCVAELELKKSKKSKKVDGGRLVGVVEVLVGVGDHVGGRIGSVGRDGVAGVPA